MVQSHVKERYHAFQGVLEDPAEHGAHNAYSQEITGVFLDIEDEKESDNPQYSD